MMAAFGMALVMAIQNSEWIKCRPEQGVPVYDPQVVAMHTLPLAARLSGTARGSRLNPDVGHKKII